MSTTHDNKNDPKMNELIIFVGLPASGKTTFYHNLFCHTHLRISRDMLKTRSRETAILMTCVQSGQKVIIDNTNVSRQNREFYISLGRLFKYKIVGFYFDVDVNTCVKRNNERAASLSVPVQAIYSKSKILERPSYDEGFDEIYILAQDDPAPKLLPRENQVVGKSP